MHACSSELRALGKHVAPAVQSEDESHQAPSLPSIGSLVQRELKILLPSPGKDA